MLAKSKVVKIKSIHYHWKQTTNKGNEFITVLFDAVDEPAYCNQKQTISWSMFQCMLKLVPMRAVQSVKGNKNILGVECIFASAR